MLADGRVWQPLDCERLVALCAQLRAEMVEAVAICFLHAYTNPATNCKRWKSCGLSCREWRSRLRIKWRRACANTPRASTTLANAYVQPVTASYLDRVAAGLSASGISAPLNIMLSSGGTTTVAAARDFSHPLSRKRAGRRRTGWLALGPAAGARAYISLRYGRHDGESRLDPGRRFGNQPSSGSGASPPLQARQRPALDGADD